MESEEPSSTAAARTYYDSPLASLFYTLWGGTDLHTGIYCHPPVTNPPSDPDTSVAIPVASDNSIVHLLNILRSSGFSLNEDSKVLDLGAGLGGAARWLAKETGCQVVCLNVSEEQNRQNRSECEKVGLGGKIRVVEGSFEDAVEGLTKAGVLGENDGAEKGTGIFDVIWSQDALLHSSDREVVVQEISHLLKLSGGRVIFSDIMASEKASTVDAELMSRILARLKLSSLATPQAYRSTFATHGFQELRYWDGLNHFKVHYRKIIAALDAKGKELGLKEEEVGMQKTGMENWVKGADEGCVEWGVLCFGR